MDSLRSLLKPIKLAMLESVCSNIVNIDLNRPIVSFCFDDVPLSGATTGAEILEQHRKLATYYIALNIKPDESTLEGFAGAEDIKILAKTGHDIGCHTWSHMNLRWKTKQTALSDCRKNTSNLCKILPNYNIEHFAYPFGMVGPISKCALRHEYCTLRSTDFGINYGKTDLSHLRACSIYSCKLNKAIIADTIKKTIYCNGWLILFSHDVRAKPSPWGITPDDLKWALDYCMDQELDVLSISQAYKRVKPVAT